MPLRSLFKKTSKIRGASTSSSERPGSLDRPPSYSTVPSRSNTVDEGIPPVPLSAPPPIPTTEAPKQAITVKKPVAPSLNSTPNGNKLRLIVGLDFGTTFSGASFALLHPSDDPSEVRISVARDWAGLLPGDTTSNKVPTTLAYLDGPDAEPTWGFAIPPEADPQTLRWLKLLLEPDFSWSASSLSKDIVDPTSTKALLADLGLSPLQATTTFLKLFWAHVKQQIINEHSRASYDAAEKHIVLTVPAVWSDAAKQNTFKMAENAGLGRQDLKLSTVAEPEAAAIAVLRNRTRASTLEEGDCFVVVDAGGGTVDLTSYQMQKKWPLTLTEATVGNGDVCGAVFLEANFRKLLRTYLGETVYDNLDAECEARIIRDFEHGIRRLYDGEGEKSYSVITPGVPEGSCPQVKSGLLRLSTAELQPIFMPVVQKIERLIRKQLSLLTAADLWPKAIVLVGGLGTNKFLAKYLKELYSDIPEGDEQVPIEILQPEISWESVSTGAVRHELLRVQPSGPPVDTRIARYNIGLNVRQKWVDGRFREEQKRFDGDHGYAAIDVPVWFLRKGDVLVKGRTTDIPVAQNFSETDLDAAMMLDRSHPCINSNLTFITSRDDSPSSYSWGSDTRFFAKVSCEWDLKRFPKTMAMLRTSSTGAKTRVLRMTYHLRQGVAGFDFDYSINGTFVGRVHSVDFRDIGEMDAAERYR
ncbi:hypothetical protein PMZ80_001501 [Knufia obscura]|uniref:Actin-like ATPase domain-containing protein n=2 Tax=Knufia TaxID=430999 RepID=A0AAN8FCD5_9EURO|nr:hypothetical protein PMZ80_001501 [Knufia obscura]KAK5955676.1 hypothetical protein OHC33_003317 [Knufia fluminis]